MNYGYYIDLRCQCLHISKDHPTNILNLMKYLSKVVLNKDHWAGDTISRLGRTPSENILKEELKLIIKNIVNYTVFRMDQL